MQHIDKMLVKALRRVTRKIRHCEEELRFWESWRNDFFEQDNKFKSEHAGLLNKLDTLKIFMEQVDPLGAYRAKGAFELNEGSAAFTHEWYDRCESVKRAIEKLQDARKAITEVSIQANGRQLYNKFKLQYCDYRLRLYQTKLKQCQHHQLNLEELHLKSKEHQKQPRAYKFYNGGPDYPLRLSSTFRQS